MQIREPKKLRDTSHMAEFTAYEKYKGNVEFNL